MNNPQISRYANKNRWNNEATQKLIREFIKQSLTEWQKNAQTVLRKFKGKFREKLKFLNSVNAEK